MVIVTEGRCSEHLSSWHNCSIQQRCQFIIHWPFCHWVLCHLSYRNIFEAIKGTQAVGTFYTTTVCLYEWTMATLLNNKSYSTPLHSELLYGGWLFCDQVQTNWWNDSYVIYIMQQDIVHFIRPTTHMYIYVISVHSSMILLLVSDTRTQHNTRTRSVVDHIQ
jgi:hypothetical protein